MTHTVFKSRRLIVPVTLAIFFTTTWIAYRQSRVPQDDAWISAPDTQLDLGFQWEQPSKSWTFTVFNRTRQPMAVALVPSCGCLSVTPDSFHLAPQASVDIDAHLNLIATSPVERQQALRDFTVKIAGTARVGEMTKLHVWTVKAQIRSALRSHPVIDLGEVHEGGASSMEISLETDESVKELRIRRHASIVQGVDARFVRTSQFQLGLVLSDAIPYGRFEGDVWLTAVTDDGELPAFPLTIVGSKPRAVFLSPSALSFGSVRVGESSSALVVLSSTSDARFHATASSDATDPNVQVAAVSSDIAPQNAVVYRVLVLPKRQGIEKAHISFHVQTSDTHETFDLTLPVSYYGSLK